MLEEKTGTKLLGVDVGFSAKRLTTGIAVLDGDRIRLTRAGSSWESRVSQLPDGFRPSIIAIDGPLLPQGADNLIRRSCEAIFVRAPFHNRCKPGLSHWGFGSELRRASAEACLQFGRVLDPSLESHAHVDYRGPIVEAFPNAFLAVLMPDAELLSAPKLKRGRRFDWLYEQTATTGRLESILAARLGLPHEVWHRVRTERNHELRAALICVLTAAFAAQGSAEVVGEPTGGWFWLPSRSLWQPWATEGIESVTKRMALKSHFLG
jgi:predicted nuclease with RNAse H fold